MPKDVNKSKNKSKNLLKTLFYFFTSLVFLLLGILVNVKPSLGSFYLVSEDQELVPTFLPRISIERICEVSNVVVYGLKAHLKTKDKKCPNQIRLVTGIIYLSPVYDPEFIYLSPLPSPESLKKYGSSFIVPYSKWLTFYVESLKTSLRIKEYLFNNVYELEKNIANILSEEGILLLLPDPLIFDSRTQVILKYWLKRYPRLKIVDLANLPIEHPQKVSIHLTHTKIFERLRTLLQDLPPKRGAIYYVDY